MYNKTAAVVVVTVVAIINKAVVTTTMPLKYRHGLIATNKYYKSQHWTPPALVVAVYPMIKTNRCKKMRTIQLDVQHPLISE